MKWILSKRDRYDFENAISCSCCDDEIYEHIYSLTKADNSKHLTICRKCAIKYAKQERMVQCV